METRRHTLFCQVWEVSKADSEPNPWGYSLHFSLDDLQAFIKGHWAKMPKDIPDEYLRPLGDPYLCEVGVNRHLKVFESEDGYLIEGIPPLPKENN